MFFFFFVKCYDNKKYKAICGIKVYRTYAEVRDEKVYFFAVWNFSVFIAGA